MINIVESDSKTPQPPNDNAVFILQQCVELIYIDLTE